MISTLDREIGGRIKARREELRLSQTRLGDALGVTFQQVQKYERGTNRVSASSLILIAEALQCEPMDLLGTGDTRGRVDWSRFEDRESHEALDAFARIENPRQRKAVLELMRTLKGA